MAGSVAPEEPRRSARDRRGFDRRDERCKDGRSIHRDCDDLQPMDPGEVVRVRGEHGQPPGQRRSGDHRVERTRPSLSAPPSESGRHSSERPRRRGIEGDGVEARLGDLKTSLSNGSFLLVIGDERPHRQFGQGDGGDERLLRESLASSNRSSRTTSEVSSNPLPGLTRGSGRGLRRDHDAGLPDPSAAGRGIVRGAPEA